MNAKLWFGLFCMVVFITGCGSQDIHTLQAVNQHGEERTLPEAYEGDYWVADFIFTNCETVCPPMTGHMSRLQQQLKSENLDARLVSVSVDPENDTQEVLQSFADAYQPDYDHWDFLTGYSYEDVKEWSIKSFQSPVKKMEDSDQMAHGTSFYLVSPDGDILESYSGTSADSIDLIISDLKEYKK
ncbi:redoxin domain-containing protein [Halobacillus litoralis]|uniref:Redoxin domain-containing protein n=1 Tax=Halobacillus litoralis TaxID=45668 RepID=A0A845DN18_9BACI|nr:SCO family protein [Halobacillus litoralis]MYL19001.1 redoxin domain-containing protein [Halobacillus litoralis]